MAVSPFQPGTSPWHALQEMREQMDRLFASSFGAARRVAEWSPAIDLEDRDDEVVLTAELPGMRPKDIDIEVEDNVVTIRGEKKEERKKEKGERFVYERQYGSFVRSVVLPHAVDPGRARARFEDRVLEVTLPKSEEAKGKRIRVEETH